MLQTLLEVHAADTIGAMPRKPNPDRPKKVNISARVDPRLADRFEALAAADERSVSYFVEKAMAEYLERRDGAAAGDKRKPSGK